MKAILFSFLFLIFLGLGSSLWAQEGDSDGGEDLETVDPEGGLTGHLYEVVRPAVFQIKTSLAANSPKASYGSGFVVSKDGYIVTNYHVIASVLQNPEDKYRIFLVGKGKSVEAKIIWIDSTRDLALIKVDHHFKVQLKLASKPVKKGEKIYSVGLPKDLNISITEGTFNGTIKYGVYEQIHMSSPINSGMSGGPTINMKGEVIGVNVSVLLNSQNISFSVPVKFVKELLQKEETQEGSRSPGGRPAEKRDISKQVHQIIESQLLRVQDSLMVDLKTNISKVTRIDQWGVAPPSKSLKCWSSFKNETKSSYKINLQYCSLKANSYLKEGLYSGDYEIHYASVKNKKRNGLQFYNLLNSLYNGNSYIDNGGGESTKKFLTQIDCSEKIIVNKNKIPFKVNFCLQGYLKFPQLSILNFKAVTLLNNQDAFLIKVVMRGFTKENIKKFIEYQLSHVKLNKDKNEINNNPQVKHD